jgi:hypothetical protein
LAQFREPFIKEANEIIISEMLMQKATESFQGTLVDALTLASSESIEREAVDKLVRDIKTPAIRDSLTKALTAAMDRETICTSVRNDYEVNRRLEPKPTLETMSRSTQIIGKILERITDERAMAGDRVKWISRLGQVFWGLVTVAAPNGILNSVFNYWIQLLYLFEILLIVGATLFANDGVQQLGIIFLILTLGLHLSVMALQETMLGDAYWKNLLRFLLLAILAGLVVVGGVFLFAAFFNPWMWDKLVDIQSFIADKNYDQWRKISFASPLIILVLVLAVWREAQKLNLRVVGRALIAGFLALAGLGEVFRRLTNGQFGDAPLIKLEFVSTTEELGRVVNPSNIAGLKQALWLDTFIFIPLYLGFLLLLCAVLKRRRHSWARWLGMLGALLAVVGAIADVAENYFSLVALETTITDGSILVAAQVKWAAVFAAGGLLAAIFWRHELRNWWNLLTGLLAALAVLGIAMTFIDPVPYVPGILLLVLLIWLVVGFLFQSDRLRRAFLRFY